MAHKGHAAKKIDTRQRKRKPCKEKGNPANKERTLKIELKKYVTEKKRALQIK